jgi:hypothetical protein
MREEPEMTMRIASSMIALLLIASLPADGQSTGPQQGGGTESSQTPAGSGSSASMLPSEAAAKARLESAGYTDVRDVKAGAEVMSAKAMKDGKPVNIMIDSFGKIIAHPAE